MMVDGTVIDIGDLPEPVRGQSGDAAGEDDVLILACTVVVDMVTEKHASHHS